jgi:hypothetical protein
MFRDGHGVVPMTTGNLVAAGCRMIPNLQCARLSVVARCRE